MTQAFRTPAGGRIRRDQPVRFTFDGRPFEGYAGDSLASALLANGVHLMGRSFKYHRPRGVLSAGVEEPNALVTIDRGDGRVTPNQRATMVELHDGLCARTQNAFPSARFDLGAAASFVSPLLAAGFYYKTFMWPAPFWKRVYEPAIRAAAGLGRAPTLPDPDRYAHQHAHCDVLVIGAGPAGIAAASAASARGDRVILCDEHAEPGGSLLSQPDVGIDGAAASDWIGAALAGPVTVLTRTTAFGWYSDNMIALAQRVTDHIARPDPALPRERLWLVRAKRVVIAAGAIERPAMFPGNDRPGILLASAAATYLHRYGVLVGRRIVVTTSHDSAWHTAFALAAAGATVVAILDQRDAVAASLLSRARALSIATHVNTRVSGTGGRLRVTFVATRGGPDVIPCDTVLMSDGWTPSVHLFSQSRGTPRFDPLSGTFLPGRSASSEQSAGACAGTFDLASCLAEGHLAGGGLSKAFDVVNDTPPGPTMPPIPGHPHRASFVDFQNDVTTKDLAAAAREGFRSIEHVKRYTTTGMATDQGKTANLNALATVAALTGRSVPAVGLTTFRPPYTPVTFGAFAGVARGALFDPVRRTPIDDQDAVFEDVGIWKRAHYFPRPGETAGRAVARECRAVREDVGLFDASTLGKIEVVGPDAAEFLNRMYTGDFVRLGVGRCKYGLLLGEDGFVRDDGVIARLAPERFHVTTTTGGAAAVLHQMEDYLQTEFPSLRVWLTSTTEHWSVIAVQGPRAADVLAPFLTDIDLAAMPHMSVREGRFADVPIRLFRVSFSGELGFEINIPAAFARSAWDLLRETGATRYGTEAMHVLRAEKGFVVVGQETDGTVTPDDLGLGWTIAKRKPDFVGKRSLIRPDMVRDDRLQLVGLLTDDPNLVLEEGSQLTGTGPHSLGHVTSSYHSEAAGRSIALAMLAGGRSRIGAKSRVNRGPEVTVSIPVFYDRDGARMLRPIAPAQSAEPARDQGLPGTRPASGGSAAVIPADRPTIAEPAAGMPDRRKSTLPPAGLSPSRLALPPMPSCADVEVILLPPASKFVVRSTRELTPPLRAIEHDGFHTLWLGPDEFLVIGETFPSPAHAAIVDVSHRTVGVCLDGSRAAWCLNAFCALDLDDMQVGGCTRTLFGKAEIILWKRGPETFQLEIARSFAPYVWGCLEEVRREFLPRSPAC